MEAAPRHRHENLKSRKDSLFEEYKIFRLKFIWGKFVEPAESGNMSSQSLQLFTADGEHFARA
jgi:hypothetical protein